MIALAMEPRDDYISAVSQDDEHEKMAYMPEDLRYILLTSCDAIVKNAALFLTFAIQMPYVIGLRRVFVHQA